MSKHKKHDEAITDETAAAAASDATPTEDPASTEALHTAEFSTIVQPPAPPAAVREYVPTLASTDTRVAITLVDKDRKNPILLEIDAPAPFRIAHKGLTYERYGQDADTGDVCYCQI